MLRSSILYSLFLSFLAAPPLLAKDSPPNILIILADDLGNGDLSYNGCKDIQTPNIDKLAQSGLILNDHHTTASVCAPSRAGLLSGKYQQSFGFESNSPPKPHGMPGKVVTYAEAMKQAGYETMALGKWHLGSMPDMHPNAQGFDYFSGFLGGGRSYFPIQSPNSESLLQRNGVQVPESEITYITNWLSDEAIRLIDSRDTQKPFFMYLSYNAPHTPMHALKEDLALFENIKNKRRRTYAAMVHNMDVNIGKIIQHLKEKKLKENTLIIFLSDNGGATTNASDNGIYRGMKGSKWEGGHRVPCVINWPKGGLSGGKRLNLLTSTLDLMPTSLNAAGHPEIAQQLKLDGINLLPPLKKNTSSQGRDTLYFRRAVAAAIRDNTWKLIRVTNEDASYHYLLFDLSKDIGETKNLASKQPERVQKLATQLKSWEETILPPSWSTADHWKNFQRLKHKMSVTGREAERKLP